MTNRLLQTLNKILLLGVAILWIPIGATFALTGFGFAPAPEMPAGAIVLGEIAAFSCPVLCLLALRGIWQAIDFGPISRGWLWAMLPLVSIAIYVAAMIWGTLFE